VSNIGGFGQGPETPAQDSGVSIPGVSLGLVMGAGTFFSYPGIFGRRLPESEDSGLSGRRLRPLVTLSEDSGPAGAETPAQVKK
jgi:hypothetical protein